MTRTGNGRATGVRRGRAALALALAALTAVTSAGTTAPAVAAGTPSDVTVLPAAPRFSPRATSILTAGETGYLLAQEGDVRLQWIDYVTGRATPLAVTLPEAPRYDYTSGYWDWYQGLPLGGGGFWGAGSDTVAVHSEAPSPHVTLQKGAGAVFADIAIPAGQTYVGTFGDTVLTRTGEAGTPTGYHLLRAGAGTVTDTPVTGFPEGAVPVGPDDGDATSLVFRYKDSGAGWGRWALVDLADGVAEQLPDLPENPYEVAGFRLGAGTILRLRTGRSEIDVLDRAAPGTVLRTVESGSVGSGANFFTVGTAVLAAQRLDAQNDEYRGSYLWRLPGKDEEGGIEPVLQHADEQVVLTPDGTALVAGAETAEPRGDIDWAVHRISPAADGGVTLRRVNTVEPVPARVYGLALGSGILTTAENSTYYHPGDHYGVFRSTWLSPAGEPRPVRTTVDALMTGDDGDCHTGTGRCAVLWASGDGFHGRRDATYRDVSMLYENGAATWGPRVTTGMGSPELVDLSGRFGLVASATTTWREDPYVVEFRGRDGGAVLERRTDAVAALWGSTLWSVAKDSATVTSKSLPAGAAGASFTTPNRCVPTQLQAAGRWVYWSCDEGDWGPGAGSGVYDRTTGRTMTVPGRNLRNVLLGDGYLVRQDPEAGLRLYDLHAGLPASGSAADVPQRTLVTTAELGPGATARRDWTVDRFGGHVAYAGADERVRVVRTGVAAPPLSTIDSAVTGSALDLTGAARWSGTWWTSKPAGAWKLTVQEDATGTVVHTVSGAEARGRVEAAWTGRNPSGQAARNGAYTWRLTAAPADGVGAPLALTGSVTVTGGAAAPKPPWRDFSGDGRGDLLALTPAGALAVRTGTGTGGLGTGATASGWPPGSLVVPFGDLSGDACNDLLVRDARGTLTRYDGTCGKAAFAPGGPRKAIGGGWNAYDALTAPGDLTGDGRTDLVARTPAGELWLYADDGAGAFRTRARIGGGWGTYAALVGAGDLDGDKRGDLLARDAAGVLWRYHGDGRGAFAPRVRIGGGWGAYDALAGVGDLTGDGRADLVARDATGVLWGYAGDGAGLFAGRTRIGGGWQMYRTLS